MTRLISIECDATEVRLAIGSSGLAGVVLEHVLAEPLMLEASEDLLSSPKTVAAIQLMLKKVGVKTGNAIFCIGRNNIELRALTLPTVDKNELPEMVRFAAMRQFANVAESWPIDYVVMPSSQENMTDCLAASINPSVLDRLNKIAESTGLTLTQTVLRPMASATMAVFKLPIFSNSPALLIELFGDEADMAVVERGHVVFMRNVRFSQPVSGALNLQTLVGEIKRTLIAAASQRSDLNIEQVRIWGSQLQNEQMCQTLSESLKLNVESLDPFDLIDASKTVRSAAGDGTGKFASSIGALIAPQVADRLIDFSSPRKREETKRPIAMYAIAGAAAALLMVGGYAWYWMSHSALDSEIAALEASIKQNEASIKLSSKKLVDWNKIENFMKGDHPWLDELEYLSQHASQADKSVFGVTTFASDARTQTASISTKFVVRKQDDIPDLLASFRDAQHEVRSTGPTKSQDKSGVFPWMADLTMTMPAQAVPDPRKSQTNKSTTVPKSEAAPDTKIPAESTNAKDSSVSESGANDSIPPEPAAQPPTLSEPSIPDEKESPITPATELPSTEVVGTGA